MTVEEQDEIEEIDEEGMMMMAMMMMMMMDQDIGTIQTTPSRCLVLKTRRSTVSHLSSILLCVDHFTTDSRL